MIPTTEFFARLSAMNWVREKFQREKAIADGADNLWVSFCGIVKESVDAFNELYCGGRDWANYQPQNHHMRVSRKLDDPKALPPPGLSRQATLDLALEPGRPTLITAVSSKPSKKGGNPAKNRQQYQITADENHELVLKTEAGVEMSLDAAAQKVLEPFLFEQ